MKRPSFQFYPADWRGNSKLRHCSEAARGAWIDILCILHDADEYGVCRWPLRDLAHAAGVSLRSIKELASKDVLKGADRNAAPFIFTSRHASRDGDPVTLVEAKGGPVWFSSRLVRDEHIRQRRGTSTRFSSENQPKPAPKPAPMPPLGERQGDGASSSSSTSKSFPSSTGADAPDPIFGSCLSFLLGKGVRERPARSFLGLLRKQVGDLVCAELMAQAEREDITDPVPWLARAAQARSGANVVQHPATVYTPSPASQRHL